MRILDKAVQLNINGMNSVAIMAAHCPSWYGLPDISGCPRTECIGRKKRPIQVKALNRCYECWNREYKPEGSEKP